MTFDYVQQHSEENGGYIVKRTGYDSLSNLRPEDDLSEITAYVSSGKKIRPAPPSEFHVWQGNEVTGAWVSSAPDIGKIKPNYEAAFDEHIHMVVRQQPFGYSDVNSAAKFQTFPAGYEPTAQEIERQNNAVALFAWVLLVWREVDAMYNEVLSGAPLPSFEEAVDRLPIFNP